MFCNIISNRPRLSGVKCCLGAQWHTLDSKREDWKCEGKEISDALIHHASPHFHCAPLIKCREWGRETEVGGVHSQPILPETTASVGLIDGWIQDAVHRLLFLHLPESGIPLRKKMILLSAENGAFLDIGIFSSRPYILDYTTSEEGYIGECSLIQIAPYGK